MYKLTKKFIEVAKIRCKPYDNHDIDDNIMLSIIIMILKFCLRYRLS